MADTISATPEGIELIKNVVNNQNINIKKLTEESFCSRQIYYNLIAGKPIISDSFKNICHNLGLNWREVAGIPEEIEDNIDPIFRQLVVNKTADFVGCEYVFEPLDNFLRSSSSGYFIIIGKPGVGKSAIAAKYSQDKPCIAYFNSKLAGRTTTGQFLEYLCKKLIKKYQLSYPRLPDNYNQNGDFLAQLLTEVSQKGEHLVIVVDALDEVEDPNICGNILGLPAHVPHNIYFILTRQPVNLTFSVAAYTKLFDLDDRQYISNRQDDIKNYIRKRSNRSEMLQRWLIAKSLGLEKLVETLAEKSENNFIYVYYVLQEIELDTEGKFDLEGLPSGLTSYYRHYWERMKIEDGELFNTKLRIICILAESSRPIPYTMMTRILTTAGEENVEANFSKVLRQWQPFIARKRDKDETSYSVYHNSFRIFLREEIIERDYGITHRQIHELMADSLYNMMEHDGES